MPEITKADWDRLLAVASLYVDAFKWDEMLTPPEMLELQEIENILERHGMNISETFEIGGDLIAVSHDGAMTTKARITMEQGILILAKAVSYTAHAHGWWNDDEGNKVERNMGEMIALMHSELSEALEAYRDNEPNLWYYHANPSFAPGATNADMYESHYNGRLGKPEGIASEFADTIIRILDTCYTLDIPIIKALVDKMEYNRARPYRHGGKKC